MALTLHDYTPSQNGYKVRLVLAQLGIPFELREMDIFRGAADTPEFLALNPNGRIPLLVLESGDAISESNAIISYLAEGTPLAARDRLERAKTLEWLFFEQYEHEPTIAVRRSLSLRGKLGDDPALAERTLKGGYEALGVMEQRLATHPWLVGDRYGIADVALYAYTHCAGQGGYELERYPAIRQWITRVAAQPGYIPAVYEYS